MRSGWQKEPQKAFTKHTSQWPMRQWKMRFDPCWILWLQPTIQVWFNLIIPFFASRISPCLSTLTHGAACCKSLSIAKA
jgi:hypothetical protein